MQYLPYIPNSRDITCLYPKGIVTERTQNNAFTRNKIQMDDLTLVIAPVVVGPVPV